MEIYDNEAGGRTVGLVAGDRLGDVPASHRHLLTPDLRRVFADPTAHLRGVAQRCPFPSMARWLGALLADNRWSLDLHRGRGRHASAGFHWGAERVRGATIGLPVGQDLGRFPAALQEYYALVDDVDWMGFGCSGGLAGAEDHLPLTAYRFDDHGATVDQNRTFTWGASPCGDMVVYTSDGRGGWLNLGSHRIHLLGTVADTIDWVYAELLARRCPGWDPAWD